MYRVGSLGWKLFLINALLTTLVLAAVLGVVTVESYRVHNTELDTRLLSKARLVASEASRRLAAGELALLEGFVDGMHLDDTELLVLASDGTILLHRAPSVADREQLRDQRRLRAALKDGQSLGMTGPPATTRRLRGVTLRIGEGEAPLGAVWVARPPWSLLGGWGSVWAVLVSVLILAVASMSLLALGIWRFWTRPLADAVRMAHRFSRGDFSARAEGRESNELSLLARALNRMRDRLVQNYESIDRQRRMLESLLAQLHEGVIIADGEDRIVLINPAAVRLLNLPVAERTESLVGMAVERCIPQHDIQRMLCAPAARPGDCGAGSPPEGTGGLLEETRLEVEGPEGLTHLLARASGLTLPDSSRDPGLVGGAWRLLMLTNITELARTIQVKTDFVANASHELRTPISTIRTAVEALERMDLAREAEAAQRCLNVIERQSRRLEALAWDLLDLARLESPGARFEPTTLSIHEVFEELRSEFAERVQARRLNWEVKLEAGTRPEILANPYLLWLVLDNLVDNAVKFSEPGGHVRLSWSRAAGSCTICVADDGCGIPLEDRERVFERFYQVERARSGSERGTGLGLSIVRHAVAAMRGEVRLDSCPGSGTRVTVVLPQPPEALGAGGPD